MTSVSDAAGDTLTITYGATLPGQGNCPSTANWCQVVTSASGRAITVGYNSADMVTTVTDPMGRHWTYGYTGSQLTSATDPLDNVTTYGYDTGNPEPVLVNDLTSITTPEPNGQPGSSPAGTPTTIAYDSSGRAISQTDPMGYATKYDWSQMNPATGTGTATVTDPNSSNKTVYFYTQGSLGAVSGWTGTTLASEQDYAPDQQITAGDPTSGTQVATAAEDGDGNITTASYGPDATWVTTTTPSPANGQPTVTTTQASASASLRPPSCTSDAMTTATCVPVTGSSLPVAPGPSPASPAESIMAPSSVPPQGIIWSQYDTHGNVLWTTTGVNEPGSSNAAYAQTTYELYKGNSVTLSGTTITCTYTPPSPSLPCATIDASGVVTQLGYDAQGDLVYTGTPDGNANGEVATTTTATTATASGPDDQPGREPDRGDRRQLHHRHRLRCRRRAQYRTPRPVASRPYCHPARRQLRLRRRWQPETVHDARRYTTTTTYNADDQSTLVADPDGNTSLTCYDGDGNTTQTVPALGVAATA